MKSNGIEKGIVYKWEPKGSYNYNYRQAYFKTRKIIKGFLKSGIVCDKGINYLENITILNVYILNGTASKFVRQKLIQLQ